MGLPQPQVTLLQQQQVGPRSSAVAPAAHLAGPSEQEEEEQVEEEEIEEDDGRSPRKRTKVK